MRARAIPFYSQRMLCAFCVPTIRWDFMFICLHSITTLCSLADNQHCCPCCAVAIAVAISVAVVVVYLVGLGAATVVVGEQRRCKNANDEWNEANE